MKKNLFIVILCLLMAFVVVSCENEPVSEYSKTVNVSNVDELIAALNSLEDSTCIVLAEGTYDFAGKTTTVNYAGQTGWMMPILKNNVMIKAANGATVKIQSTDDIANETWATQMLMLVVGENFVLDGITMGWRGSKNKIVEICAKNTLIKNCTFAEGDGSCLYLQSYYDGSTLKSKTSNTKVSNCTFEKNSSISCSNGAEGLTMKNNTFQDGSIIYLTGKRDTGWNDYSIDMSTVVWEGNTFATGVKMILKATDEDWSTSFGSFDPTTFGLTLDSNVDPVAGHYGDANLPSNCTYNARIKTYVKK